MDLVLWFGAVAITINFAIQMVRMILATRRLESYLAERHPQQYRQIYVEGWMKKAFLWPFTTHPNPVEFVVRSREDFGDPQVAILRARVKQSFALMLAAMVALPVWFLVLGLLVPVVFGRQPGP